MLTSVRGSETPRSAETGPCQPTLRRLNQLESRDCCSSVFEPLFMEGRLSKSVHIYFSRKAFMPSGYYTTKISKDVLIKREISEILKKKPKFQRADSIYSELDCQSSSCRSFTFQCVAVVLRLRRLNGPMSGDGRARADRCWEPRGNFLTRDPRQQTLILQNAGPDPDVCSCSEANERVQCRPLALQNAPREVCRENRRPDEDAQH